jgi:hypothetical protein
MPEAIVVAACVGCMLKLSDAKVETINSAISTVGIVFLYFIFRVPSLFKRNQLSWHCFCILLQSWLWIVREIDFTS